MRILKISEKFDEKVILERIKILFKEFEKENIMISIAESCTGGYISHMITNIPGASKVFERGVITYSNKSKSEILGVDPETIKEFGAASDIVAKQMAEGIRRISNSKIGIGITGIAGPTGGTKLKPVGLVYVSYSFKNQIIVDKYHFQTSRIKFKIKVLETIINRLESIVQEELK